MSFQKDWNAESYDLISTPLAEMGEAVLRRLSLRGNETVLDVGCGTGRITQKLIEQVPQGRVVALDVSPAMIEKAQLVLRGQDTAVCSDAVTYQPAGNELFDAVFSTATFHWIADHQALFHQLAKLLKTDGQLVAQCGGGPDNVKQLREIADEVAKTDRFRDLCAGFVDRKNFATPQETEQRLKAAGFREAHCWLEQHDVTPQDPHAYLRTICLMDRTDVLNDADTDAFVTEVLERFPEPVTIDYVRLNIDALK